MGSLEVSVAWATHVRHVLEAFAIREGQGGLSVGVASLLKSRQFTRSGVAILLALQVVVVADVPLVLRCILNCLSIAEKGLVRRLNLLGRERLERRDSEQVPALSRLLLRESRGAWVFQGDLVVWLLL